MPRAAALQKTKHSTRHLGRLEKALLAFLPCSSLREREQRQPQRGSRKKKSGAPSFPPAFFGHTQRCSDCSQQAGAGPPAAPFPQDGLSSFRFTDLFFQKRIFSKTSLKGIRISKVEFGSSVELSTKRIFTITPSLLLAPVAEEREEVGWDGGGSVMQICFYKGL